jgi:hypothetical protein
MERGIMRKSDMKIKSFRIPDDMERKIKTRLFKNAMIGVEPSTWQGLIESLLKEYLKPKRRGK